MLKKYKYITILVVAVIAATLVFGSSSIEVGNENYINYTIVIDAGHGGRDGGVVGHNGTIESELNLKYAQKLTSYFLALGVTVVNTRSSTSGLYSEVAKNKKLDDMQKREEIIKNSKPDMVLSIHMNGYPTKSARGIGVFYKQDDEKSKIIATKMQEKFIEKFEYARLDAKEGDYYILNCSSAPAILIECGFLTNPDEEKLLNTDEHCEKICFEIFSAISTYSIFS